MSAPAWMVLVLCALAAPAGAQTVEYIHTDALGSIVAITNAQGTVIEAREYEPYGQQLTPVVEDGPGYTGHVQDAETGLTYMQQRYYDPGIGMFLSVDPVTAYSNPVGQFHRYRYANNNPFKFLDPDGRISKDRIEEVKEKLTHQPHPNNKINKRIYRKDGSISQSDGRFNPPGGRHRSRKHDGVDVAGNVGEPVPAAADGTATVKAQRNPKTGELAGYGNYVDVDHGDGIITRNAHLDTVEVESGDTVTGGETIGSVGMSGNASTPHNHFEIIVDGERIDPSLIFDWDMQE